MNNTKNLYALSIIDIYVHKIFNKNILILLDQEICIFINLIYGCYFHYNKLEDLDLDLYKKLQLFSKNKLFLKQISYFEGVSVYIEFNNGVLLELIQEIEDFERNSYYNNIKLYDLNNNLGDIIDLIEDINNSDEMKLEECENIPVLRNL